MEPRNQVIWTTGYRVTAISQFSSERANMVGNVTSFAGNVNFIFLSWISCTGAWSKNFPEISENHFHPKTVFFLQRKGRKRVKEWRKVTSMKEWVKPLYIGYLQALDLPQNLFSVSESGHIKISLGPTQFLFSIFHGLLKLIFHTNLCNGA